MRYRRELGQRHDPQLGRDAAAHLRAAGRQARGRADDAAARNLLERALELASADGTLNVRIAVDLADELLMAHESARADELIAIVEHHPDMSTTGALLRLDWLVFARPREATSVVNARLPALLDQLAGAGDERGLARAHLM